MTLTKEHLKKLNIDPKWQEPIIKSFRKFNLCNSKK